MVTAESGEVVSAAMYNSVLARDSSENRPNMTEVTLEQRTEQSGRETPSERQNDG